MEEKSPKIKEQKRYLNLSETYKSNSSLENKFKELVDYSNEDYFQSLADIYNTTRGFVKLENLYKDFTVFMDYIREKNKNPSTRLFSMSELDVKEILNRKSY